MGDTLQLLGRKQENQGGYQNQGYGQAPTYQQPAPQPAYAPAQQPAYAPAQQPAYAPVQQPAAPQNIADNDPSDDLPF